MRSILMTDPEGGSFLTGDSQGFLRRFVCNPHLALNTTENLLTGGEAFVDVRSGRAVSGPAALESTARQQAARDEELSSSALAASRLPDRPQPLRFSPTHQPGVLTASGTALEQPANTSNVARRTKPLPAGALLWTHAFAFHCVAKVEAHNCGHINHIEALPNGLVLTVGNEGQMKFWQ